MSLALWLLIYLLITYAVGRVYEVSLGWKTVRLIFYPGMLVAGLGRMLACLLGSQKPGQIDLLRSDGPSGGGTDKVPGGWWFRFLLSIGPFAVSLAAFILAWHLLGEPLDFNRDLPRISFDTSSIEKVAGAAGGQLSSVLDELKSQRLGDWKMWAFIYLGFCFIVAPAPSRDDMISVGLLSAGVGAIVLGLTKAGIDVVTRRVYSGAFWEGFSFLLAMSLLVLAATLLLLLPLRFLTKGKEN